MKKNFKLAVASVLTSAFLLAGCTEEPGIVAEENVGKTQEIQSDKVVDKSDKKSEVVKKEETKPKAEKKKLTAEQQYQEILETYSVKLKEAAPRLAAEYISESKSNTDGINGLANLSNEKIYELAEISNEGVQKMAEVMYSSGSGSYTEYEAWGAKLMEVYMKEGEKITDAYLNSAM